MTDLALSPVDFFWPFEPDLSRFLGDCAHLRSLTLSGIRFSDLLILLLHARNPVVLRFSDWRFFFLLDEMVAVLYALTRLEQLDLKKNAEQDVDNGYTVSHRREATRSYTSLARASLSFYPHRVRGILDPPSPLIRYQPLFK